VVSSSIPEQLLVYIDIILGKKCQLIKLPLCGLWRFKELLVPNFFPTDLLSSTIAPWYREKLQLTNARGRSRYYLSRDDSRDAGIPRRKVVNENEVIRELTSHGFKPIYLSGADVNKQIELFSEADFVIGPHGAAFANMLFAPPGSRAIVLENEWAHTFMADMLENAGHSVRTLVCRDAINRRYEAAFIRNGELDSEIRRSRDMVVNIKSIRK